MTNGSVNKVFLIGNLGANPEIKYILEGVLLARFTVATSIRLKDKDSGENKIRTEWHKVVAYNKNAELVREYLKKGSKVFIEGYIKSNIWQGEDGVKKTSIDIIVQSMCLLDKKISVESYKGEKNQQQLTELDVTEVNDSINLPF